MSSVLFKHNFTSVVLLIFLINFNLQNSIAKIIFKNIKCESFDQSSVSFRECQLKVVCRKCIALNIYAQLHQLPLTNIHLNLAILKKFSIFRPYLNNITAEFCDYLKNKRRFPFLKIFADLLMENSNINHTCPYNHDIIVSNLILREDMLTLLPLPSGDYLFHLKVAISNVWKADIKAYFSMIDDYVMKL